tara:strand:+ start:509 stop:817 length:309 start_codon:yes stop_codon:yes gene_type:complete
VGVNEFALEMFFNRCNPIDDEKSPSQLISLYICFELGEIFPARFFILILHPILLSYPDSLLKINSVSDKSPDEEVTSLLFLILNRISSAPVIATELIILLNI